MLDRQRGAIESPDARLSRKLRHRRRHCRIQPRSGSADGCPPSGDLVGAKRAPLALEIKRQCEAEETSDVVSVAAGSCG